MKKLLTYLIGLLVPIMSIAQADIPEGYYYIVSAGNGPGYYTGSTPPETNYNFENMYALYNSDGIVKWKTFTRGADQEYYISPDGADGYYIKSVLDASYIQAGISTYNCDVLTSTEPTSQELVSVDGGKYVMKNASASYVYAFKNSHNGPTTESGNLSIWGTVDEAQKFGVNVWYLVPIEKYVSETITVNDITYNLYDNLNLAIPISISEDVTEVNINHSLIYNENEYTISYLSPRLFSSSENLCSINVSGFDDYESIDGILYKKDGESLTLFAYPKARTGDISWPENLIAIGAGAFKGNCNLSSLILPESITSIGDAAFSDCASLTSIEIPNSVTSIGSYAFDGCSSLTSAVIGESVTSIGNSAFSGCTSLTSIETPNSVTSIGDYAFDGCSSLTSVVIGESVTSIGRSAFAGTNITTLEINSASFCANPSYTQYVVSIFGDKINKCIIGEGVQVLGSYFFENCLNLKALYLPSTLKTINTFAFNSCSNINEVHIGSIESWIKATRNGYYTYPNNNSGNYVKMYVGEEELVDCVIPDGVTNIPEYCFDYVKNIASVTLGDDVATIGRYAFRGCTSLTSVKIGESVTSIGSSAFSGCSSLISAVIGQSVSSIGNYAFNDCRSLTSIEIPNSVISIGEKAFNGCTSLTSAVIGQSVSSIGNYAFYDCSSLTSAIIGESVSSIGSYAFWNNNKLDMVINHATTPQTVSTTSFPSHTLIAVPEASYEAYKTAGDWASYATNLQIVVLAEGYCDMAVNIEAQDDKSALHMTIGEENLEKVISLKISGTINSYDIMILRNKMIHLKNLDLSDASIVANDYEYYTGYHSEDNILGTNAFYNCALKLNTIKLPRTLIQINPSAFQNCTRLISVECYDGIENIEKYAFFGCSNLMSINLPNTIQTLGTYAFQNCSSLKSVDLPENITTIPSYAFSGSGLDLIYVPKDVKAIDTYAFSGCSSLKKATMPATLDKIANYAFQNCTSLESIKIPSGITKIGNNAFAGCNKLNNVYTYTVEPTSIDMNTFATFTTATLWVPEQSYYNYYYDTQWSKFLTLKYFNEPYEYFYINKDYEIQESTGGAIDGAPDADINEGSGLITKDDVNQELGDVHVKQDADTNEGGSIIAEGESTITGNKIYHDIKVSGGKWYFFSFPFNVKISDIICGGQYIFREYDGAERAQNGTGNSWKKLPADQEYLEAGKGYIFHTSKAGVLSLPEENAEISAEDKVLALEVHASANSANASWNFIGNPNTSYYDMDDMKFGAPITVWDSKTQSYVAYRPGDDNYQLAPYEAFFVQTSESAKNVEFDAENQQTHKEAKKNKENKAKAKAFQPANPTRSLINLTITGANGTDKTRVVFNDDKALAYEAECDAAKFLSDASVPQLYSHDGQGVKYAINERPNADGTVMLGFISTNGGDYTIEATRSDIPVLLKDNETGAVVNITDQAYNFTAKSGTFDNRFLLVQDYDATGIEDITAKTGVEINVANGAIEFGNVGDNKIKVFDIAGSLVVKAATDKATVAPGIYVVKVGNYATKVSVK